MEIGARRWKDAILNINEINAIDKLMNYKETIPTDELLQTWSRYLTPNMNVHIRQLFKPVHTSRDYIVFIYQCLMVDELYYHSELTELLSTIISQTNIQQYLIDLLDTITLCLKDTSEYTNWIKIGAKRLTAFQLVSYLFKNKLINDNGYPWIKNNNLLLQLHRALIMKLYSMPHVILNLLPGIIIDQKYQRLFTTILDIDSIMFLKSILPVECQKNWRLLFSSSSHNECYQSLTSTIINQGSTILIVKDNVGNIFGGYASHEWTFEPTFYGDSNCFLFSLLPHLNSYCASKINNNFMYMNIGQRILPNGIGMGGNFDNWGLWIDSNYGNGQSSNLCETYINYSMLSSVKDFKIDSLEVWCVNKKEKI